MRISFYFLFLLFSIITGCANTEVKTEAKDVAQTEIKSSQHTISVPEIINIKAFTQSKEIELMNNNWTEINEDVSFEVFTSQNVVNVELVSIPTGTSGPLNNRPAILYGFKDNFQEETQNRFTFYKIDTKLHDHVYFIAYTKEKLAIKSQEYRINTKE